MCQVCVRVQWQVQEGPQWATGFGQGRVYVRVWPSLIAIYNERILVRISSIICFSMNCITIVSPLLKLNHALLWEIITWTEEPVLADDMQETIKVLAVINNYRLNSLTQLVYTMVIWINQYNLYMLYGK